TPAAVRGRGRRTRKLSHAVGSTETSAASGDSVAQREVAHDTCGCEVTLGPLQDFTWKVLMRGHALRIGVSKAVRNNVKPRVELILVAWAYRDSARRHRLDLTIERETQHVLKRHKAITTVR